jgi:tetratricopeptide (TPR) repeat protein
MLGDAELVNLASARLAQVHYHLGDYEQSLALATKAVDPLRVDELSHPNAIATRLYLTLSAGEVGRFAEARRFAGEAARIAQAAEDPYSRALAGQEAEARRLAHEALELARTCGERAREAWALNTIGEVCSRSGPTDFERTAEWYRRALALADDLAMRPAVTTRSSHAPRSW